MKNKDFYKQQLYEVTCKHDIFAVNEKTGEVTNCKKLNCSDCLFYCRYRFPNCDTCNERAIEWLEEEHAEPPILSDAEKQYLENFIRPFKDRVIEITKRELTDDYEYLSFYVKSLGDFGTDSFDLPLFKCGAAYRGMKQDARYTLNKLGLFASEEGDNEE